MAGAGNVALRVLQCRVRDAWELSRNHWSLILWTEVDGRVMGLPWRKSLLFFIHLELAGKVENILDINRGLRVTDRKQELDQGETYGL